MIEHTSCSRRRRRTERPISLPHPSAPVVKCVPEDMLKGTGRLVGWFAAALGVGACGSVASKAHGGVDGGLTADQACATLAQTECGKRAPLIETVPVLYVVGANTGVRSER